MIFKALTFIKILCIVYSINCSENGIKTRFFRNFRNRQFSFPGTIWCGPGNKTHDFEDLGFYKNVDECCRNHDECDDYIDPGRSNHGLTNWDAFFTFNCYCDKALYNCLRNSNSSAGDTVGSIYFTLWGPQCFSNAFPIVGCLKRRNGKCVSYKFDEMAEKRYQWFDNPKYSKKYMYPHFS